jgi:hypothetical protein
LRKSVNVDSESFAGQLETGILAIPATCLAGPQEIGQGRDEIDAHIEEHPPARRASALPQTGTELRSVRARA